MGKKKRSKKDSQKQSQLAGGLGIFFGEKRKREAGKEANSGAGKTLQRGAKKGPRPPGPSGGRFKPGGEPGKSWQSFENVPLFEIGG